MSLRQTRKKNGKSNFCKEGFESKHNLTYWNFDEYIGIGANASYFIENTRYTNINNLSKYYSGIINCDLSYREKIILSENDLKYEFLMVGFRKLQGISLLEFNNRFNDINIKMPRSLNYLEEKIKKEKVRYLFSVY